MKILDWYILKRYLVSFFMLLLLFIPIGIVVDLADRIDNILASDATLVEVLMYYLNFTIYFANLLFPIFIFISVIWFTSKLANNTEIIAFLSSGVSFSRFLRPFFMGALIVSLLALFSGIFIVPKASKGYNEFKYEHINKYRKDRATTNIFKQINENDIVFVSNFIPRSKTAQNFVLEHFEDSRLKYKITAKNLKYITKDSIYRLTNYSKITIGDKKDVIETLRKKDTLFSFDFDDLTPVKYAAETKGYLELIQFIEDEQARGSSNVGSYRVVLYKKWSLPVSVFILTVIAVAVSSIKRRGGMGVNLAFGLAIALIFVFFDKIFGVLAEQSNFSPIVAVWVPNLIFGILAGYLLYNAKR